MEKALLIERSIVELDVVAPHAPEAGQDLREGGHDEVLAVPKSRVNALISSIRSISVNLRLGSSSPLPIPSPSANWPYGLLKSSCCLQFDFLYWVWLESSICALSSHIISRRSPIPFVPYIMQQFLSTEIHKLVFLHKTVKHKYKSQVAWIYLCSQRILH